MFQIILDALKTAWDWFLGVLHSIATAAHDAIISLAPDYHDQISAGFNRLQFAFDAANAWAPVQEVLAFASVYMSVVAGYLIIKILLKMIP